MRLQARLKALSDRSGDHGAGGRKFGVAGPLTAKLRSPVAVPAREPVECQSLQIVDAAGRPEMAVYGYAEVA